MLLAGVSTRSAAESAARAGFAVTAIDAFADLDQDPRVRALSLPRDFGRRFTAAAAARAARSIECDAVGYLSTFENHPQAVSTLAAGRVLWGNPPAVLRRVRNPILLAQALRSRGLPTPSSYVASGCRGTSSSLRWLVKPLASGGGHRVRPWRDGARVPRGCYLQEFVDGASGSAMFVAAGGRAVLLGVTRQLVGEHAFGASGYRYCGSILAAAGEVSAALVDNASVLAHAVADEFGLVGVNGIDFIARDDVPYAIEINPRWSASLELVERAYGLSVFGAHAAACTEGTLPAFDFQQAQRAGIAFGKAVVFALRDAAIGDTHAWLADSSVRDVPRPGERIAAGRPVCTVFAEGRNAAACHAALVRRAQRAYAELDTWVARVA